MILSIFLGTQIFVFIFLLSKINNRSELLFWFSFLIPLISISFETIVLLYWAKVMFPIVMIVYFVQKFFGNQYKISSKDFNYLSYFFIYSFSVGIFLLLNDSLFIFDNLNTLLQSSSRYIISFTLFVFVYGLIFIGLWFCRNLSDYSNLIKGFIYGNVLNLFLMLYQFIAFYAKIPWLKGFWIMRLPEHIGNSSLSFISLSGLSIPRLSGFGGEPKHAGTNLCIALFLLVIIRFYPISIFSPNRLKFLIAVTSLGIIMTFSVSAYIGLLIITTYYLLILQQYGKSKIKGILKIMFATFLLMSFFNLSIITEIFNSYIFPKFNLEEGKGGLNAYMDVIVISALLESPINLFLGLGFSDKEVILSQLLGFEVSKAFSSPAYSLFLLISNIGLIGFSILSIIVYNWIKFYNDAGLKHFSHTLIGIYLLIVIFGHHIGLYFALLLIGATRGLANTDCTIFSKEYLKNIGLENV